MKPTELQKRVQELVQTPQALTAQEELLRMLQNGRDGLLAIKFFCDLEQIIAPIDWLPHLDKAGLLVAYRGPAPERLVSSNEKGNPEFIIPLVSSRWSYARTRVSESAHLFSIWLAAHIDKREFIDWVLEQGGVLHPELRSKIVWQLWSGGAKYNNKGQPTPYSGLLQILTNLDINYNDRDDLDLYLLQRGLKNSQHDNQPISPELHQRILWLLQPTLKVSGTSLTDAIKQRSIYYEAANDQPPEEAILVRQCYGSIFELDLPEEHHQEQIQELLRNSKGQFANLALDAYGLLKRTFDLLYMIKEGSHTYIQRPYIKDSSENRGYAKWDTLVDLCRDSLSALWQRNPAKAKALIKVMFETEPTTYSLESENDPRLKKHIIFTRLALFSLTENLGDLSASERYKLAFPYKEFWLYSWDAQPEVAAYLKSIWNELPERLRSSILSAILRGDSTYKGQHSKKDIASHKRIKLRRLQWLKDVDSQAFPERAEKVYRQLVAEFPEKDPFSETVAKFTMERGPRQAETIDYEQFYAFAAEKHLEFIAKNYDPELVRRGFYDDANNADQLWQELAQKDSQKAISILIELAANGNYPNIAWSAVLRKFGEKSQVLSGAPSEKPKALEWKPLLEALQTVPNSLLTDDYNAQAGGFLREAADCLKNLTRAEAVPAFPKDLFTSVWEKLLECIRMLPFDRSDKDSDMFTQAINHPSGTSTEALFNFMWAQCHGKYGDVSLSFTPFFDKLIERDFECLILARVILASNLFPSFIFLPEWTLANVLPGFDWERNEEDAECHWNAYLYHPRVSQKLSPHLIPLLVQSFEADRLDKFDRTHARDNLVSLAAVMMLDGDLAGEQSRKILTALNASDKAALIRLCQNRIGVAKQEERQSTWESVKDWLLKASEIVDFSNSKSSDELLELILSLDLRVLERDWPNLKPLVGHLRSNDLWMLYSNLLPEKFGENNPNSHKLWQAPRLTLDVIATATPEDIDGHAAEYLAKVLAIVRKNHAEFIESSDYQRLLEIQVKCG